MKSHLRIILLYIGSIMRLPLTHLLPAELVHLIDPYTLKIGMMGGQQFYRETFEAVCHQKQLREFMVMNIEEVKGMLP